MMILRDLLIVMNSPGPIPPRIEEHLEQFSANDWAEAARLEGEHIGFAVAQAQAEAELATLLACDDPDLARAHDLWAHARQFQTLDEVLIHTTKLGPASGPLESR